VYKLQISILVSVVSLGHVGIFLPHHLRRKIYKSPHLVVVFARFPLAFAPYNYALSPCIFMIARGGNQKIEVGSEVRTLTSELQCLLAS